MIVLRRLGWFLLLMAFGLAAACSAKSPAVSDQQGADAPPVLPKVVWVRDIDHRAALAAPAFAEPALAGDLIVVGGQDSRAHVLSMSGREKARFALAAPSESGAAVLPDGTAVLADAKGMLYALDIGLEKESWRKQLSSTVLGRPVVADSTILVQTADNRIYAFGADGEKRWSFASIAGDITIHAGASPVVSDGIVYAIFSNGDVAALRLENGNLIWRRQLFLGREATVLSDIKAPISDPVVAGELLILSFYQGEIIALSRNDGERVWTRKISLRSTPLLLKGNLYAAAADGAVLALDPLSGETQWKQEISKEELIGPVAWQDNLLLADADGGVYVMNASGGQASSLVLSGRIDRAPLVSGQGVLLRNTRGSLYLLR